MQKLPSWMKQAVGRKFFDLRLAFAFVALQLCGLSQAANAPRFTASLDRDSIVMGESVMLTLTFEGGAPQEISQLPAIDGLQNSPGVSQSSNTTIGADGTTTSVQSYGVTLSPTRAGEFVIPAFRAKVNGQTMSSQPLKLKVLASDPSSPPADFANQLAFLWLVLPKQDVYVGETFVAEMRLYIRSGVANVTDIQIPQLSGEGFNSGKYIQSQQFQRRVGTTPFTVIPFRAWLSPVKSGPLSVGPINGSLVVHLSSNEPRDVFENFFGPRTVPKQIALALQPKSVSVSPLPTENVPPSFNGAVGSYTMTVAAGPTNVAAGDPITVRVQISGNGALESLTLPDQPAWHDFKLYPPTAKVETTDQLGVQGTKSFEQLVVPQSVDIKELPPISFSFFDPDKKKYETLTKPAIGLVVRPGGSNIVPVVAAANRATQDIPPPAQDIVSIKQRPGKLEQISPPLVEQPWFLALQSVPALAFIGTVIWRKRSDSLANNPRLRRQRKVAQIVRDGMNDLRKFAAEKNSDQFFATLFRLLQEQLGERLDLPASAITEAVIEEHLQPRGLPEADLAGLHELFQTCNLARYAPVKSSQELEALIPKLESVLDELQELEA
jgi:BatD DUF11 like domain